MPTPAPNQEIAYRASLGAARLEARKQKREQCAEYKATLIMHVGHTTAHSNQDQDATTRADGIKNILHAYRLQYRVLQDPGYTTTF